MVDDRSTDPRWDMHSDRQISASKSGATAVTVLNSGSWLALLSQAGNLGGYDLAWPILAWGMGALLGTLIWLIIYRGAMLQGLHDFDRDNKKLAGKLDRNIYIGVSVAIGSLACFGIGVILLAAALI